MPETPCLGPNHSHQLRGALAPATVVAAAATASERLWIGGAGKVQVDFISATFSATATTKINLYGVFGDARIDGDGGQRTSAPIASATIVSVTTALSAVTWPYQFVDVEIAPGASSGVTIAGKIMVGTAGPST